MVVTCHQPNFLPGASVLTKIAASDACVWLDEVQYTKGGWTSRNKLPDGSWLTVPVERHCAFKPINRVRIGNPIKDWRSKLIHDLLETWPGDVTADICREIMRPYELLVGLNVAILDLLLSELAPSCHIVFQSHLAGGHTLPVVSNDREMLKPISHRIAHMVAELGGDVYLSGPSGKKYLSEEPFAERGIAVEYWSHQGENPCALSLIEQEYAANS